ncbi:lysylphosphatidylglycerol synthase transmembrane domain-containing protein [Thiorhodovibrio winogradskyi]|nr:lysylphosphatidylglycerol synthase transmembrane domain-containing protein [Thiorhodovibrio winogradskyi]
MFVPLIRRAIYWGLPPLILFLIYRRIDLEQLLELGRSANPGLIGLGVLMIIPLIFLGAMRWHQLARGYDCTRLSGSQSFRAYWFSLALGVFTPGSLGSDVYRIALGGRQTGRYLRGAFVIAVEKVAALLSCVMLITAIYPFLTFTSVSTELESIMRLAYLALLLGILTLLVLGFSLRSRIGVKFIRGIWSRITLLANRAVKAIPGPTADIDEMSADPRILFQALVSVRIAAPLILLSVTIHVIGAIQGQIFLQAQGYDLPFLVNLFIAPLNVLVLTLPITVGGVGVREGAFVLFYGAFGVPTDTALLISLYSFISVLFGHTIGGLIFLTERYFPITSDHPEK